MKFCYHNELLEIMKTFNDDFSFCNHCLNNIKKKEYVKYGNCLINNKIKINYIDWNLFGQLRNTVFLVDNFIYDKDYPEEIKNIEEIGFTINTVNPINKIKHGKFIFVKTKHWFFKEKRTLFYWNNTPLM